MFVSIVSLSLWESRKVGCIVRLSVAKSVLCGVGCWTRLGPTCPSLFEMMPYALFLSGLPACFLCPQQIARYHSAFLYIGDLWNNVAEAILSEILSQVSRQSNNRGNGLLGVGMISFLDYFVHNIYIYIYLRFNTLSGFIWWIQATAVHSYRYVRRPTKHV